MEQAASIPAQQPFSTAIEQPTTTDDGIRIHPHVYGVPLKSSGPPEFRKELLRRLKGEGDVKRTKFLVEEYAAHLSRTRSELLLKLGTPLVSDTDEAVSQAFQDYAALLVGLALPSAPVKAHEEETTGAEVSPQKSIQTSKMRSAVAFEWEDVLLTKQAVVGADAVFELASAIIAISGWRMRRAAFLCRDSRAGISSAQASKAYRLVLLAAGGFQYVNDSCAPALAGVCTAADTTKEAASALLSIALADAQGITTLRAMAKNNVPGLIASLALDTAALYQNAASSAHAAPASRPQNKALIYAEYKAAVFQAYALCFTGLMRLQETQAGQAVRLLEESKQFAAKATPLAAAYNKAEPSTPAADHKEFDTDLSICVDSALARVRRDNDHVYYQRPPQELPALPEPRRLVNATPLVLPAAAPQVTELSALDAFAAMPQPEATPAADPARGSPAGLAKTAPGTASQLDPNLPQNHPPEEEAASCWRWLLVILAMPFLVVLTVFGIVLWIVLLPVKIICCPIGCAAQILFDVVEYVLKAPFRAMLWASGKPWKAKKPHDIESQ